MCQRPKRAFFISTLYQKLQLPLGKAVCQRPKRAFFISTKKMKTALLNTSIMCQRPKRAFFISTTKRGTVVATGNLCQRPKRAFFISTLLYYWEEKNMRGVNALNGLSSFLPILRQKKNHLLFRVSTP